MQLLQVPSTVLALNIEVVNIEEGRTHSRNTPIGINESGVRVSEI